MKHKKATSANILTIGIISLLAVGSWVIFDVYRAFVKTTVPEVLRGQIEPLQVNLSNELIAKLRARKQFDPLLLNSVRGVGEVASESAVAEVTPTIEPTPEATTGATLQTQESTPAAGVSQ